MRKIGIASGKGGTGKTTVSVNLAYVLSCQGRNVRYWDCDVEEPDGHIYFDIPLSKERDVLHLIPEVDESLCTFCKKCEEICQFKAIMVFGEVIVVNKELCHACGGCTLACEPGAIKETGYPIGRIETGKKDNLTYSRGLLSIGSVMATPVISDLKNGINLDDDVVNIIDSPPGTSCPVIEALKGTDYVILVTEPTPFGLHDLRLSVLVLRELKIKHGIVINKSGIDFEPIYKYIREENIPLLMELPFSMKIAEASAEGKIIAKEFSDIYSLMEKLIDKIKLDG